MRTPLRLVVWIALLFLIGVGQAAAKPPPPPPPPPGGGLAAWDVVPTPSSTGSSELLGIAALSSNEVWAVGYRGAQTLTERWNGSAFSVVPSPNVAGRANVLEDVAGTASNNVWAVGHADRTDFVGSQTLILRWNGNAWSRIASPNRGSSEDSNRLTGIAVISPNDAWAVGGFSNFNPGGQALTFHWNGTSWTDVPNPCGTVLREVFALSSTNVWAVGATTTCRWNGQQWTRVPVAPSPNPQQQIDLQDVTGTGANSLWAVGLVYSSCGEGHVCFSGVIERWNGSSWSYMGVPWTLYGVDAVSATEAYATGMGRGPTVVRFNGTTWDAVPTPTPLLAGTLFAIDAPSGGNLWAAGSHLDGTFRTLAQRAPSPTAGAVVGATGVYQATVSWFGPESGSAEADTSGRYQAGGLNAGQYTFIATNPGCTPAQRTVTVVAGTTITADLAISC